MNLGHDSWVTPRGEVGGCALWTVDLDAPVPAALVDALSASERERAGRFVHPHHRRRYQAAHAALRLVLGSWLDRDPASLRFETGPHGKPGLPAGQGPAFNLSHSEATALIALDATRRAERRIGVDVELPRPIADRDALARNCFDAPERADLRTRDALAQDDFFLQGWTRKEACLKAVGDGFSSDRIPSTGIDTTARHVDLPGGARAWLTSLALPRVIAALAVIEPA